MSNQSPITSVRGNSVPPGGASSPTTAAGAPVLASTDALRAATEALLDATIPNNIQLQTYTVQPGQETPMQVRNVGLGYELEELHLLSFTVQNTSDSAVTLNVALDAPFNIVSQILTTFNGAVNIHNCSGGDILKVMVGRKRNIIDAFGMINPDIANITVSGDGVTTTSGTGLCNLASITIGAGATATIEVVCWMLVPFTFHKEIMLGILPMQNNSIYLNTSVFGGSLLGSDGASMLYNTAGVSDLTITVNNWTLQPTYNFLQNISNTQLILPLASVNYLIQTIPNQAISSTGLAAINQPFKNNFLLVRFHSEVRDVNKLIFPLLASSQVANVENPRLSYNGVLLQDSREIIGRNARSAFQSKGGGLATPGHILFDLQDFEERPNALETSWMDMYSANNPAFMLDIPGSLSLPGTFRMVTEQLVPADVSIISG